MRDQMLTRFRSHFADKDKGYFYEAHERQPGNQVVMMSKEDSDCGGNAVPSYYIEYLIEGVRPVDVFNVIADTLSQPEWLCKGCTVSLVENDVVNKVQGYAAAYRAGPINRREFYQWQGYNADFVTETFMVGAEARDSKELKGESEPLSDVTVGRMCYSYSHISKDPNGTRVVQMSHFNVKPPMNFGPFTPRNMYNTIWPLMLQRVPKIMARSRKQTKKGWGPKRLVIDDVFMDIADGENSQELAARYALTAPKIMANFAGDDLAKKARLPWLIAAFVLAVLLVCAALCGSCSHFGLCTCLCPARKAQGTPSDQRDTYQKAGNAAWCSLDEDAEAGEDSLEE